MGATVGYVETFGQGHVVIEFPAAPGSLELQLLNQRSKVKPSVDAAPTSATSTPPNLSFAHIADLRPGRPSVRLS